MKLVVDTNALSEARRPQGDPWVKRYLAQTDGANLYVRVVTLGELARGIAKLPPWFAAARTGGLACRDRTGVCFAGAAG